jgi:hypothetical protein
VKDLGLSNGAAAYRRAAVELVQRFPQVLEPIRPIAPPAFGASVEETTSSR